MSKAIAGRPRATARVEDGRTAREQILDAAAELFASRGYAATSTRHIAERAGIRQASLYYHVEGKAQMLIELLDATVRPTLEGLEEILRIPDPAEALRTLVLRDVRTLLEAPHNLAVLYLTPELDGDEFASIREARVRLRTGYARLAGRLGGPEEADFRGSACMRLVEMVIELRQRGEVPEGVAERIAESCLRVATPGTPRPAR